ncbi:MAG: hypothetical protein SZ59_C0002G0329 [candidate division TM6 bacterium GW2011_GWF2_28_16]|nr:MAG: hypothetical protein SZ59_C0002G0329 [candidate division TM6 bacterium GW2011_GWF2_28_16]
MNRSLISVVLGSYNRYDFLKLTIDSVRKELVDIPHEIIVVDGGSTDGVVNWLIKQKDIITILQHNRGIWRGKSIEKRSWGYFMNLGFRASNSKYVCMISDDCLLLPGAIKNGLKLFEEQLNNNQKIGAVAFYAREWNKETNYCVRYTVGKKLYVNHGIYLKQALCDVNFINEDDYFFYNADSDLCLKMWQLGYKIIDSKESFVEHYPHANIKIRSQNHEKYLQDAEVFLKNWKDVFYDGTKESLGFASYIKHEDVFRTGDKYKNLYLKNYLTNPGLFIPEVKRIIKRFINFCLFLVLNLF